MADFATAMHEAASHGNVGQSKSAVCLVRAAAALKTANMHWIKLPPAAARSSSGAMPARIASSRHRATSRTVSRILYSSATAVTWSDNQCSKNSRACPLISGSSRIHSFQDFAFQDFAFQDFAFQDFAFQDFGPKILRAKIL